MTVQIEIAVVCQVQHRICIADCLIFHTETIFIIQTIPYFCAKGAGIAFFSIGAGVTHAKGIVLHICCPDFFVKAFFAAMKMVCTVITVQFVFHTIEDETTFADTVCESACYCTHKFILGFIIRHGVITQHHICSCEFQGLYCRAVCEDRGFCPHTVFQGKGENRFPCLCLSEKTFFDFHILLSLKISVMYHHSCRTINAGIISQFSQFEFCILLSVESKCTEILLDGICQKIPRF